MDDSCNRDICPPEWHRRSLVDSGFNTPQSMSRWSIDSSEHLGDKMVLSRPQSPRSHLKGSRPVSESECVDGQKAEQAPHPNMEKRPSLPPLRGFLGELAFSPPHSPPLPAQVDHRIHSINLPPHKALAFYPSNASRLERPEVVGQAFSPPDSPASAPLSLPERKASLTRPEPREFGRTAPRASSGPSSVIGDATAPSHFPASRARIERRPSLRSQFPGYHPYESQSSTMHQRPRGLSTPMLVREYGGGPTHPYGGPGLYHLAAPPDGRYPVQAPPGMDYYHHGHQQYAAGPYDYSLARTRKRSNLPKQSTEIMKKWFDEHIESPYPSEEQKRQFAAAANINLTQVSNWFINHRRRCPELKNRREKAADGPAHPYDLQ